MRAQLVPIDGGPAIDIVKDLVVVGRKEECDVRLEHKSVSKMHCVIVKTDGLLLLRDLGSTNGTRVNGLRVAGPPCCPTIRSVSPTTSFGSISVPMPRRRRSTSTSTPRPSTCARWPTSCARPRKNPSRTTTATCSISPCSATSCLMCIPKTREPSSSHCLQTPVPGKIPPLPRGRTANGPFSVFSNKGRFTEH